MLSFAGGGGGEFLPCGELEKDFLSVSYLRVKDTSLVEFPTGKSTSSSKHVGPFFFKQNIYTYDIK